MLASIAWAGSVKFDMNEEYMVLAGGTSGDGTKLVQVTTYGKNDKQALEKAKMYAVAAAIFRGIQAGNGANETPSLTPDQAASYYNNKAYFDEFFNSDRYLQFVNFTNSDMPTGANNMQTKKGRKVTIFAQIMHVNLRKQLEADGIIKPLAASLNNGGNPPLVVIVPETGWCKKKGYIKPDGDIDFKRAFEMDDDLRDCISTMVEILTNNTSEFEFTSAEKLLDEISARQARKNVGYGSTQDNVTSMQHSDLDELSAVIPSDLMIELSVDRLPRGGRTSYKFRMTTHDSSSLSEVHASAPYETDPTAYPASKMIVTGINNLMDGWMTKVQKHFEVIDKKGREGQIELLVAEDSPVTLHSRFTVDGDKYQLSEIIDAWMDDNCVDGVYNTTGGTPTQRIYSKARIPLKGAASGLSKKKKEVKQDAEGFCNNLSRHLKSQYGIESRVIKQALGKATIYIGVPDED